MKGVVLCGGESSRMGTDKGMLLIHRLHWVQTVATLFTELNISFVISVNEHQKLYYGHLFHLEQLIIDDTAINVKGPLLALLSLHKALPKEDLLVIACDMIEMQNPPLQLLLDNYNKHFGFDTYLFKTENKLQPLCAIYTADFLSKIFIKVLHGELKRFGLTALLNETNNHITAAPHEWINYFNNYNRPEDVNRFQKLI